MRHFVLDVSVTMGWILQTQSDEYCKAVLKNLSSCQAIVPGVWLYEVANMLRVHEDRKNLSREVSNEFYQMLYSLPVEVIERPHLDFSELLLWMSKSHRLTPYDTAYLYLAMDRGFPLATRDKAMLREARRAGVHLYQP